jgi:hypothetical protein
MPDSKVDAPGPTQDASILATLRESPPAVKAVRAGILVNRLGQFITIYLVLFMTHRGFSAVSPRIGRVSRWAATAPAESSASSWAPRSRTGSARAGGPC